MRPPQQALADSFTWRGHKIPRYFWFMLSGFICDIFQLGVDHIIYTSLTESVEDRATIGWTVSYICSIAMRHSTHKVLVFGEYGGSYWMSLGKTYLTYSSSIVISMLTNYYFTNALGMTHSTAAIITLLWTGIYNFFLLKACWNSGKNKKVTSPKTEDGDADDKV